MKPQYQYFVVTIAVNWLIDWKGCRFETGPTIDIDPFSLCRFPSPNPGTKAATIHLVPKVEWIAHGVAHRHPINVAVPTATSLWKVPRPSTPGPRRLPSQPKNELRPPRCVFALVAKGVKLNYHPTWFDCGKILSLTTSTTTVTGPAKNC